jgi:hypothetical protein
MPPQKAAEDPSLSQLTAQLQALGLVAMPMNEYKNLLAKSIATRLCNRVGRMVYQTAAYNLPLYSRTVAEGLFHSSGLLLDSTPPGVPTWRAESQVEVASLLGTLLETHQCYCAGVSRALKAPKEKSIRVLSTIIAPLEISWAKGTLFLNFAFVLSDQAGELHPPKDQNRREIELEAQEVTAIRAQILHDLKLMADWGYPLSKGFYSQIGMTEPEEGPEEAVHKKKRAKRKPPRPKAARPPKAPKAARPTPSRSLPSSPSSSEHETSSSDEPSEDEPEYEIDAIIEARRTTGRARCWYLVRWAGYHPSWEAWRIMGEPGTPIVTWEKARHVEGTETWRRWRAEK